MKKLFTVLILLVVVASFLSAGTISWKWRGNDENVNFYRYRMDDGEWKVVENESYEVRYDSDLSIPHTFEIQQSYDGVSWSESKISEYIPYVEEIEIKEDRPYSRSTIRFNIIPQENVTVRNSNTGVDDYYAEYSFGLETNGTFYFNKILGLGLSASFNGGIKKLGESDKFFNFGFYLVPAIRIVSNNTIEVAIKGGVGVEIEPYNDIVYIAPSFLAQIDANVFLFDRFSLAISPGVIFDRGDFLVGSTYQSSNVRILSIGASWSF